MRYRALHLTTSAPATLSLCVRCTPTIGALIACSSLADSSPSHGARACSGTEPIAAIAPLAYPYAYSALGTIEQPVAGESLHVDQRASRIPEGNQNHSALRSQEPESGDSVNRGPMIG